MAMGTVTMDTATPDVGILWGTFMPVLHDHSFSNDDLAIAYQVNSCRCSHPVQINNNYTVAILLIIHGEKFC